MKYIKDFLDWAKDNIIGKTDGYKQNKEQEVEDRLNNLNYYYLQLWVNSLRSDLNYMLCEELPSSTVITHLHNASHEELRDYIKAVFIPSHPPKFIVIAV